MRDIFTHQITTPEHWYMLMQPTIYRREELRYDLIVGDQVVTPTYDPHCVNDISGGCHPVQIISGERLVKADTGIAEGRKIAQTLENLKGVSDYLIEEEAWECIWTELIINRKGLKTFLGREGIGEYYFSSEMLALMLEELDRLITKYSADEWSWSQASQPLVDLLQEHHALIQIEYDEVEAGTRLLKEGDFLGPKERKKRKIQKMEEQMAAGTSYGTPKGRSVGDAGSLGDDEMKGRSLGDAGSLGGKKDYSEFFKMVNKKLHEDRKNRIKEEVFEEDRERHEKLRKKQ